MILFVEREICSLLGRTNLSQSRSKSFSERWV